jgi:hypothetical protein
VEISYKIISENDPDSPNLPVTVYFCDDDRQWFLRSCDIEIWLNKERINGLSLSEIEKIAKDEAILYLQDILTVHAAKNE